MWIRSFFSANIFLKHFLVVLFVQNSLINSFCCYFYLRYLYFKFSLFIVGFRFVQWCPFVLDLSNDVRSSSICRAMSVRLRFVQRFPPIDLTIFIFTHHIYLMVPIHAFIIIQNFVCFKNIFITYGNSYFKINNK